MPRSLKALAEAVALINADREAAVQTYIRVENSKIDPDLLRRILADPEIAFTMTPRQTDQYASFMHKIGAIKAEPASWRDYFFPEAHALEGELSLGALRPRSCPPARLRPPRTARCCSRPRPSPCATVRPAG